MKSAPKKASYCARTASFAIGLSAAEAGTLRTD
jgi:hypothetical protein